MTTIITTESGREYTFRRTTTQDVVCTWVDEEGDAHVKGSRLPVMEHVRLATVPHVGACLRMQGINRYTLRTMYRTTTPIVSIVRNGEDITHM